MGTADIRSAVRLGAFGFQDPIALKNILDSVTLFPFTPCHMHVMFFGGEGPIIINP